MSVPSEKDLRAVLRGRRICEESARETLASWAQVVDFREVFAEHILPQLQTDRGQKEHRRFVCEAVSARLPEYEEAAVDALTALDRGESVFLIASEAEEAHSLKGGWLALQSNRQGDGGPWRAALASHEHYLGEMARARLPEKYAAALDAQFPPCDMIAASEEAGRLWQLAQPTPQDIEFWFPKGNCDTREAADLLAWCCSRAWPDWRFCTIGSDEWAAVVAVQAGRAPVVFGEEDSPLGGIDAIPHQIIGEPRWQSYGGTDADCVYIWRAAGHSGKLHKIGMSSWRLGDLRLRQCAHDNGLNIARIDRYRVPAGTARALEDQLLVQDFDRPVIPLGDGRTEFRLLDEAEASGVREMLRREAIEIAGSG